MDLFWFLTEECKNAAVHLPCSANKVSRMPERLTLLVGSNYSPTADSSGTYSGGEAAANLIAERLWQ